MIYVDHQADTVAAEFPQLSIGFDRVSAGLGLAFWAGVPLIGFLIGGEWAAAGFAIGLVSLCLCPFFIFRLSDTREKLRIDELGITDLRSNLPTIPWEEIERYSWRQETRNGVPTQQHVDLLLLDGSSRTLNLTKLTASIDEVCRAIDQGVRAAHCRHSLVSAQLPRFLK